MSGLGYLDSYDFDDIDQGLLEKTVYVGIRARNLRPSRPSKCQLNHRGAVTFVFYNVLLLKTVRVCVYNGTART